MTSLLRVNVDRYLRPEDGIACDSVAAWRESQPRTGVLVTAYDPIDRRAIVDELRAKGVSFGSRRPVSSWVSPFASFEEGSIAFDRIVVMTHTRVGHFAIIMPGTSVGHDATIGDFVSIGHGCAVSGYVDIGENSILGEGTVVHNGTIAKPLVIGRNVRIAARSVVTKSVPPGAIVAGNPARIVRAYDA